MQRSARRQNEEVIKWLERIRGDKEENPFTEIMKHKRSWLTLCLRCAIKRNQSKSIPLKRLEDWVTGAASRRKLLLKDSTEHNFLLPVVMQNFGIFDESGFRPPHKRIVATIQGIPLSFPSHSSRKQKAVFSEHPLRREPSQGPRQSFLNENCCLVPLSVAWFGSANN